MNNKLFRLNISSDYELEFRIKDIEFINSILKKPTIKPVSFEDAIVLTYIPTINFKKYKYRSTHILNSISSDKYERKELIYRDESKLNLPIITEYSLENLNSNISNIPNPLVYPAKQIDKMKNIDIFVKYSRETSLSNVNSNFDNLKIDNIYRKLRITYNVPGLNFKIDLTCRYYPILLGQSHSSESSISNSKYKKKYLELNIDEKQKIIKELMEEMKYIKFKPEQVLKFENIDGYNLEIDMEFEYLHNSTFSLNSISENSNSQNVPTLLNEYNKLICFLSNYDHITFSVLKHFIPFDFTKSPQVNILTNQIINTPNSQNNFVWSEKMDGIRYLLIIYNNYVYSWQNVEQLKYLCEIKSNVKSESNKNIYILDCEKINNSFYVFDCYIFNNNDIRKHDYITRLKYAKTFINNYSLLNENVNLNSNQNSNSNQNLKLNQNSNSNVNSNSNQNSNSNINQNQNINQNTNENSNQNSNVNSNSNQNKYEFKLLDIYKISDWNETIKYALSKHDNTDGIVLHTLSGIDTQKWPKVNLAYKLKPIHLNTIDFLYIYIPSHNNYQLYLSSNYQTFIHALRSKSINDKVSQELFNYDLDKDAKMNENYYILFDCPYFENMWKYEFNENDLKNLNLKSKLNSNSKEILNHLIIESQYLVNEHRWQPIRIRYDKEYPNNYNVGLTNVSLIFDPPYLNSISENSISNFQIPKNIEKLIRTYIWDYITINNSSLLPFSNEPIVMIDYLADSRDVMNYYNSNIIKIFATSNNNTKLVDYTNSLKDIYLTASSYKHVITVLNQISHPRICLNVFNKNDFEKQLIKSNDFNLSEINMIFVNNLNTLNSSDNLNVDLDEILKSNIKDYCNVDAVILYVYLGNDFNEFYEKYSSKIIHYFNPLIREDFINYLLNIGIPKMEIDKYSYLVNCVILKI
jgi:hypothetical protein